MNQPRKHLWRCLSCGETFDVKDLSEFFKHGWVEEGRETCFSKISVPNVGSKKIISPVEYLKKLNDALTLN